MPAFSFSPGGLRRVMKQQLCRAGQLLDLAHQLNHALQDDDVTELQDICLQQQVCLKSLDTLEKARIGIVQRLTVTSAAEKPCTLEQLMPHLPNNDRNALTAIRAEMMHIRENLELLQQQNRMLLTNAVHIVEFSLFALTEAALQPARYGTNLAQIAAPSFYVDSKA